MKSTMRFSINLRAHLASKPFEETQRSKVAVFRTKVDIFWKQKSATKFVVRKLSAERS